jgi:hypothetical protein
MFICILGFYLYGYVTTLRRIAALRVLRRVPLRGTVTSARWHGRVRKNEESTNVSPAAARDLPVRNR